MLKTIPLKRLVGTRKDYDQEITACCQECSVGCGLRVYVKDDRIVDVQGDEQHLTSRGKLCARGIAFVQGLSHPDRITIPATRNRLTGPFEAVDNWEKGIELLAERLRRVKDQHGAESLVIGCDPEAGLDFYLGAQRFAKLFGTPHVYHPEHTVASDLPHDQLHPTASYSEWAKSRCILLVEADLANTHPVAFGWLQEAQRQGTKIIAVDTRYGSTLSQADKAFTIAPSSGNDLGLALMKMLIEENLVSDQAMEACFDDSQAWQDTYTALSLDDTTAIGMNADEIRSLALMLGRYQPITVITGKRLAFSDNYGIWPTLATAMGWSQMTGGGWYPLDSGVPRLDPTSDLDDNFPASPQKPLDAFPYQAGGVQEADMEHMNVQAIVGSGNCLNDFFAPFKTQVNDMDLVASFGSFPNDTRDQSHMLFPATFWAERDSLMFTNEGAAQWSPRLLKPSDACRTGLGFWTRLAQCFGWEEHFPWVKANGLADHDAFYAWLLKRSPDTTDLDFAQVKDGAQPVIWGQTDTAGTSQKIIPLAAPKTIGKKQQTEDTETFPLSYQATRMANRASDASSWWPWTRELEPEEAVQINPVIAEALAIENGETIIVASANDTIEGKAWVNRMVPPQLVWSSRRMKAERVLIQRKGQSRQEARDILKAIEL